MDPVRTLGLPSLADDLARVEESLHEAVSTPDRFLAEVASHLIGAGGKRIRPTLTLCAAYAVTDSGGPVSANAVTGAVAIELVHQGSLYHDDVIDEAETRRGVPSVNARWSNIVAILAGDFLASTIAELCRGQVLELQHLFDVDRSEEGYSSAIEGKTASLFGTSCRVGGMVSGVGEPTLDALTKARDHAAKAGDALDGAEGLSPDVCTALTRLVRGLVDRDS